MATERLTIGQLAASTGVSRKTIRVWTRRRLLTISGYTPSGYQLFGPGMVGRARFIHRARLLGLGLSDIESMIHAAGTDSKAPCVEARRVLQARLDEIDAEIAHLVHIRGVVKAACEGHPRRQDTTALCPIIERSAISD